MAIELERDRKKARVLGMACGLASRLRAPEQAKQYRIEFNDLRAKRRVQKKAWRPLLAEFQAGFRAGRR